MRVISQDGTIDVPYEQVVIQCFNREIYFLNKNLTGVDSLIEDIKMASYSTEEKAEKAMEMLRTAYYNNKHEETYKDGVFDYCPNFMFPQDSEVLQDET